MKNSQIAILVAGIAIAGSIVGYKITNSANTTESVGGSATYSLEKVKQHNNANSCWMVINRNVYDVTSYISLHPRPSQTILSACGTDATSVYSSERKHRGREALLATFKIGVLS